MSDFSEIGSENVKVSSASDGVALLRLDRLAKRNAFSQSMIDGMVSALVALDKRDDVRVLIVAGGPQGPFCGRYASIRQADLLCR
jgi:enoyl-CoA hydratase